MNITFPLSPVNPFPYATSQIFNMLHDCLFHIVFLFSNTRYLLVFSFIIFFCIVIKLFIYLFTND